MKSHQGRLEVVVGCMYSGKTEELVRRLRRASIAGQRVAAFKPALDDRYHATDLASHMGETFKAVPVSTVEALREEVMKGDETPHVIGFDEAQFMEPDLIPLLDYLASLGIQVIVAGLDMDYLGKPFGPIPRLLALADEVTKLHAVCTAKSPEGATCGQPATRSFRAPEADSGSQVQVGSTGVYEARCRMCWHRGQIG